MMKTRRLLVMLVAAAIGVTMGLTRAGAATSSPLDPLQFGQTLMAALPAPTDDPTSPPGFTTVKPQEFDPAHTGLVQAAWLDGTGCPTGAFTAVPNATFTGFSGTTPYVDTACTTGDPQDQNVEGLLLAKTGPTNNFAAAVAELNKVKNITLTELGYDIRKSGGSGASALGSHCGAGAPRFNIVTTDGNVHFLGCNSPPGMVAAASNGWVRLRWDATALLGAFPPITSADVVSRIQIVFDEGQDAAGGPDQFGAAFLDNIDVNGTLVGHGATDASASP